MALPVIPGYNLLDGNLNPVPGTGPRDFGDVSVVTKTSNGTGNWNNAATWSPAVIPAPGDVIKIRSGDTVTYDAGINNTIFKYIDIEGTLTFPRTGARTLLIFSVILVKFGGYLDVGTQASPIPAQGSGDTPTVTLQFADQDTSTTDDPGQYGPGIIVLGKFTCVGATKSSGSLLRMDNGVAQGSGTVVVADMPVVGWQANDIILLAESRQFNPVASPPGSGPIPELGAPTDPGTNREILRILSINPDNMTINLGTFANSTIPATTQFVHEGSFPLNEITGTESRFYPHIANFSRSILIISLNNTTQRRRGIIYVMDERNAPGRAYLDIQYTELRDLSRTDNRSNWNDTTYDGTGNPLVIGTNQSLRNALTLRNFYGPTSNPPTFNGQPFQFVINGLEIRNTNTFVWANPGFGYGQAITLDNAHWGYIGHNHIFNTYGFGIGVVGGFNYTTGYKNRIEYNVVALITGTGARFTSENFNSEGNEGDAFYHANVWSIFDFNLANEVGLNLGGTASVNQYFYGFIVLSGDVGLKPYPLNPGDVPGTTNGYNDQGTGTMKWNNNECYSAARGFAPWHVGTIDDPQNGSYTDWGLQGYTYTFFNWIFWNVTVYAVFDYMGSGKIYDTMYVRGNTRLATSQWMANGNFTSDYYINASRHVNCDMRGIVVGVEVAREARGTVTIENCHFECVTNILVTQPSTTTAVAFPFYDRTVIITNPTFSDPNSVRTEDILMEYSASGGSNIIMLYVVKVYQYNGNNADNIQIWRTQQAKNVVVPASGPFPLTSTSLIANNKNISAVSGSTNLVASQATNPTQSWIFHDIAPDGATTRTLITNGLVAGIPALNPSNLIAVVF